jgi:putative ABC transport system permease protein
MWMPVGVLGTSLNRDRLSHQFWMIGRLRRAATLEQARVELNRLQDQLAQAYPASDANWRVAVAPLLEHLVGNVRTPLWVLSGAVGFVLLIAGSNVVNLLLARAIAREKEFAVRSALGAVRWRLVRQSLTESLLMALAGAGLAVVLAVIGLRGIGALSAGTIPRFEEPHLNGTVLAVGAALALVTTLLVGIAPGLQVSRPPHGRATTRLRNGLVVAEVALTLLLLSGAGLMIRSFAQLRNVDPGFDPRRLTTVKIALPETLYPHVEQRQAFLHLLLQELNATPGITSASATDRLPLSGESNWGSVNIVGRPMLDAAHAPVVEGRAVSATYFRTLGIRLLRGRAFTEADISQHRHVTVINDVMARQFWPGADPIGQRVVDVYHQDDTSEIIGVVANVKDFALDAESAPDMYRPYTWWTEMNLMLRGGLDQTALVGAVRRDVAALDREVPVYEVTTMRQLVDHSVGRQRFELFALAFFALISLALAAVGIYGVLAFAVSRRTREMGIRIALGAPARRVLTLIISQGMKLVLVGIGLGVVGSLGLTRLMSHLLFHVSPADPSILVTVGAIVGLIGALACVIPARRATRVDPIVALRREP